MSASQFLQYLTQMLYVLISLVVTGAAVRRPTRARIDIAAFFGIVTLIIAESWLIRVLGVQTEAWLTITTQILLMALPYILVRLVNDFATVPPLVLRGAEVGLALAIIAVVAVPSPLPVILILLLVLYFCGFNLYVAVAFLRAARRSSGVTRRRMQAVAAGSGFLGLSILLIGLSIVDQPTVREVLGLIEQVTALASGLSFFLGFAPPSLLRRAWQEPELRAFLSRAASLPRLPDTGAIVRELERGAEEALGAPHATIGLWDEGTKQLIYHGPSGPTPHNADLFITGQAFMTQRALFSGNTPRDDPQHAERYRTTGATAILAAPITAGDKRLGVLAVFASRAPIFAEEDLRLVQLLADQGAVILESRALIDEAARVQAREEATRLKDDFLSAAAHDLKTPLTALIATAQLLERRALRQPERPPDLGALRRMVSEGVRLRSIVVELLDAARVEQRGLLSRRETVDLTELVREVGGRYDSAQHRIVIAADGPVVGSYDRARIAQLLENLIENAVKYSPAGGEVRVKVWSAGATASLTVTDSGIGIPPADLPRLFERFHRGTNVDDRQFAGMGLGLYICRGIVEEHGGQIVVSSTLGQGTTFQVTLPYLLGNAAVPPQGETSEQVGSKQPV